MSAPRRTSLIAAAALAAVLLAGCTTGAVRDDEGEIVEGGSADVFSIKVGDCLVDPDVSSEAVSSVPTVPCAEPHDYEVYHEFDLTLSAYDEDAVAGAADLGCYEAFEAFVGTAYEESTIDYTLYQPTEDGWTRLNDRAVSCLAFAPEQVTGTLAGSGL